MGYYNTKEREKMGWEWCCRRSLYILDGWIMWIQQRYKATGGFAGRALFV